MSKDVRSPEGLGALWLVPAFAIEAILHLIELPVAALYRAATHAKKA